MTSCRFGIVSFALSSSPCTYKGPARSVDLPAKCATRRSQLSMPVLDSCIARHNMVFMMVFMHLSGPCTRRGLPRRDSAVPALQGRMTQGGTDS